VDRQSGFKEVWRAELLSRLALLDQVITEQGVRTTLVRGRGWDVSLFESRAELLLAARQHYVALLKQLLEDGKPPMSWTELDPSFAADPAALRDGSGTP
jgi:hypothetical protein